MPDDGPPLALVLSAARHCAEHSDRVAHAWPDDDGFSHHFADTPPACGCGAFLREPGEGEPPVVIHQRMLSSTDGRTWTRAAGPEPDDEPQDDRARRYLATLDIAP